MYFFRNSGGEIISFKNTVALLSVAVIFFMIVGCVAAADGDAGTASNSSQTPEKEVVRNASFCRVPESNYIVGDTFEITLKDDNNGSTLANKSVYFLVNNKITDTYTDENGSAKFLLNLSKGTYDLKVFLNESGYKKTHGYKKILVLSKPVSTVKGTDLKAYAGIKKTFKVTLNAYGMPISGRKVKFVLNKKTYNARTNANGQASITVYLSKGTYTVKYYYAGEHNIKASSGKAKITVNLKNNPYKTKYRHVYIDADGGFTKAFLNDIASKLRKAGWKVTVYGIGPGQHSKNYKKVKNAVYMPFYNGLCAATIKEMTYKYYGGVLKKNKAVLAPSWYTDQWVSEKMSQYRNDITKIKYLKRAWDDNFSPSKFKGLSEPAKFMTKNNIKYSVGDTTYKIVEQFLYGGWDAHH